jgi:S1-C subfamily serine protease
MQHRGDRTTQLERLARLADGPRPAPDAPDGPTSTIGTVPSRRQRFRRLGARLAPFASGVLAVLVALALYGGIAPRADRLSPADVDQRVAAALASQVPGPPFSATAFAAIAPSLVLIQTKGSGDGASSTSDGLGSGVVVTPDGGILTALHVVHDADVITITFADGSTARGYVISEQPLDDIAIVRAYGMPKDIPPAVLGNPRLPIGSEAFVVGSPYGLYASLSAGVVSGHDRTFRRPGSDTTIDGLIQVDAAVNPGNSGGPLIDRAGNVVGIVIALINPTDEDVFIGIGLAVPIDIAGAAGGLPPY